MSKLIKWLNPPEYKVIRKNFGGMSERPNEHAWKACIPNGIMGSNPIPSTIFFQKVKVFKALINFSISSWVL